MTQLTLAVTGYSNLFNLSSSHQSGRITDLHYQYINLHTSIGKHYKEEFVEYI